MFGRWWGSGFPYFTVKHKRILIILLGLNPRLSLLLLKQRRVGSRATVHTLEKATYFLSFFFSRPTSGLRRGDDGEQGIGCKQPASQALLGCPMPAAMAHGNAVNNMALYIKLGAKSSTQLYLLNKVPICFWVNSAYVRTSEPLLGAKKRALLIYFIAGSEKAAAFYTLAKMKRRCLR